MWSIITSQSAVELAFMRVLYRQDLTVAPFTTLPLNSNGWPRPRPHPARPSVARMRHRAIQPTRFAW